MKIVHLTTSSGLGGAERVFLDLAAPLAAPAPRVEPHLIAPAEGPLLCHAAALGAAVTVLPMPGALLRLGEAAVQRGAPGRGARALAALPAALRYVASLRAAIGRLRPAIVHTHGIKQHLLASLAARGRAPVVWHLHDFLGHRAATAPLFRAVPRPAAAVAISHAVADDARRLLPGLSVTVVHNGIDTDAFLPEGGDGGWLDDLAGLPRAAPGSLRLGLLATYARWKGHVVLLDAIARLVRAGADRGARFYIIGGPIYDTVGSQLTEAELRASAEALGVGARVGFVPFQADPARALGALDVVIHASTRREPFGRTIAEAMSSGKPVILTRGAGAAELLEEGRDALVVPPGDSAALAAALATLLADPERRRAMGRLARLRAVEQFSRRRMAEGVREVYLRVLGGEELPGHRPQAGT